MIVEHITDLIGNTPLLKIPSEVHGLRHIDLYAKLEYLNPFGSLKDRVAWGMVKPLLDDLTESRRTVIEASSGNTGKALCSILGTKGLKFRTITNRIKNPEVRMVLQVLGAEIEELPGLSDCPDPNDPNDYTTVAANLAATQPDSFVYINQYHNERNRGSHYRGTGEEIANDLPDIDYFFAYLGTCGSSMGAGQRLREQNPGMRLWGIVSAAGHHVPGGRTINELWEVGFFRRDFFDELLEGTRPDAVRSMLELNRRCGMLCGPTSGLTYHAGLNRLRIEDDKIQREFEGGGRVRRRTAVFIACDRMEWYLSYVKATLPDLFAHSVKARPTVEGMKEDEVASSPELSATEVQVLLAEDLILLDIRGHFAYSVGHIEGSINILDEYLTTIIEEGRVFPLDRVIVVVCRIGTLSRRYAAYLRSQGYRAFSLKGGIDSWRTAGLPLERTLKGTVCSTPDMQETPRAPLTPLS